MKKITFLYFFVLAVSWQSFAQFPESFETAVPPNGWTSFRGANDDGIQHDWTQSDVYSNTGTFCAFVRYESVNSEEAQDWLVTPEFTPTSAANFIEFYQRQRFGENYGSTFDVLVSTTSQTDISSFVIVDSQTEDDVPLSFAPRYIDLSAYNNQAIYVAFRLRNNDGDSWYIDDVDLILGSTAPECVASPFPEDMASAVEILGGELTLSWVPSSSGDAATSFEFFFGESSDALSSLAEVAEASIDLINLDYSTTYYWQVIPKNSGGSAADCAIWSFTTQDAPPVPANDACSNAELIGGLPFSTSLDATSATNNDGFISVADCGFGLNDGVWYTFTPSSSGTVSVEISNVIGWDPELAVYSGSCGDFVCVAADDSGFEGQGEALTDLAVDAGTTYFITLGDFSSGVDGPEGPFDLTVTGSVTLGLDNFENAFALSYFPNPVENTLFLKASKEIENIKVFNLLGQEVMQFSLNAFETELNFSRLETGTYFLEVSTENSSETIRIAKN